MAGTKQGRRLAQWRKIHEIASFVGADKVPSDEALDEIFIALKNLRPKLDSSKPAWKIPGTAEWQKIEEWKEQYKGGISLTHVTILKPDNSLVRVHLQLPKPGSRPNEVKVFAFRRPSDFKYKKANVQLNEQMDSVSFDCDPKDAPFVVYCDSPLPDVRATFVVQPYHVTKEYRLYLREHNPNSTYPIPNETKVYVDAPPTATEVFFWVNEKQVPAEEENGKFFIRIPESEVCILRAEAKAPEYDLQPTERYIYTFGWGVKSESYLNTDL
jgi:hypothetical protein